MKQCINGFLVVEGTNDKAYLSSLFDCEIVCTNGYDFNSDELPYIIELSKVLQPIILTDSDSAGKEIRNKLNQIITNAINIEVDISKCNKHKKHGVAECEKEELISVLKPYLMIKQTKENYYDTSLIMKLGIDHKDIRDYCSKSFHLGKCNSKQLARRLSLLNIKESDIVNIVKEYKSGN